MTSKGQRLRSHPDKFGVKYIKNGTRWTESVKEVRYEVMYGLSKSEHKFDLS